MITKKKLRNMATGESFSRGEDYFGSDSVRKLKRISEYKFTAKVRGSESYDVSLDLSHDDIDFDCDCPYDYDGICKHCVAMGLAVIEAFGDKPFTANT